MVSKGRLDQRRIERRPPHRQPKRRVLIVCEGRKTERCYFQDLAHHARNPLVHAEVAKETGVPLTVVEEAVRLKHEAEAKAKAQHDENLRFDDVWSVFDIDDHPNVPEARQLAVKEGVDLAVSNPCFELWAVLHFQEQEAHIHRRRVRQTLQQHLTAYDKLLDFAKMHPGYADAVRRAKKLEEEAEQHERGRNPTTCVFLLTELIAGKS